VNEQEKNSKREAKGGHWIDPIYEKHDLPFTLLLNFPPQMIFFSRNSFTSSGSYPNA